MNANTRPAPQQPIKLHRITLSGHCHRVEMFLVNVMEQELAARPFLAGDKPTLADVANYSYVARAPEGRVSLEPYPMLRAWPARIEALPGFVPIIESPVGLAA